MVFWWRWQQKWSSPSPNVWRTLGLSLQISVPARMSHSPFSRPALRFVIFLGPFKIARSTMVFVCSWLFSCIVGWQMLSIQRLATICSAFLPSQSMHTMETFFAPHSMTSSRWEVFSPCWKQLPIPALTLLGRQLSVRSLGCALVDGRWRQSSWMMEMGRNEYETIQFILTDFLTTYWKA